MKYASLLPVCLLLVGCGEDVTVVEQVQEALHDCAAELAFLDADLPTVGLESKTYEGAYEDSVKGISAEVFYDDGTPVKVVATFFRDTQKVKDEFNMRDMNNFFLKRTEWFYPMDLEAMADKSTEYIEASSTRTMKKFFICENPNDHMDTTAFTSELAEIIQTVESNQGSL